MSILRVGQIQNFSGDSALSTNSSGISTMPNQPNFLIYSNGPVPHSTGWINISRLNNSSGVSTAIKAFDISNSWSLDTGRFTAPVAGRYLFYAGGWIAFNGAGNRYAISFPVNGGNYLFISGANTSAGDTPIASSSIVRNLVANDYVECHMFSSVSTNLGGSSHSIYFGGYLIS